MARRPKTIRQRIALDGGKELREDLQQLGEKGEKAFQLIKKAVDSTDGPAARLGQRLEELKDRLQRLAARVRRVGASLATVGRNFQAVGSAAAGVARRIGLVTAAAAGAAAAIFGLANSSAQAADNQAKAAEGLGLAIDEYGRLQFAAEQAGVDQDAFGRAVNRVNQLIGQQAGAAKTAAKENRSLAEQFAQNAIGAGRSESALEGTVDGALNVAGALRILGVKVRDASGRLKSTREFLFDLADAFAALPEGVDKAALAVALFPELGRRLLPFLNQGRAGIEALGRQADDLGIVFTDAQAKVATAFVDAENRTRRAIGGLKDQIGLLFAPELTAGADRLTEAIKQNRDAILGFSRGAVAQAVALVEDLLAAIEGRDADVRHGWILEARDAVVSFAEDAKAAYRQVIAPAFRALLGLLDQAAGAINALFGTKLTGRQLGIALAVGQFLGVLRLFVSVAGLAVSSLGLLLNAFGVLRPAIAVGRSLFETLIAGARAFLPLVAGLIGWPALIVAGLVAAGVAIVVFWDDLKAGAVAAFDAVTAASSHAFDLVAGLWSGLGDLLDQAWDSVADAASSLWGRIETLAISALDRIMAAWRRLQNLIAGTPAPAPAAGGGGFARGGPVRASALNAPLRGPGTTTSDSILGWLSKQEFVLRARAVSYYGSDFLRRLNALQIPRRALPGFSAGGLVEGLSASLDRSLRRLAAPAGLPGFAAGGPVLAPAASSAGGRPVVLQLDGRRYPMTAPADVAEQLTHSVLGQQRRRTGRMPDWFGG